MLCITVDVGTTNSRIRVVEENEVIAVKKSGVGIKDISINGSKDVLIGELRKLIINGLEQCSRNIKDVDYFVASGMITSNLGLCEIPHRLSPASIKDLADGIVIKKYDYFWNIPFYFIPGVKNNVKEINICYLKEMDMMRGEEVESFGIVEMCSIKGPCLIVLPGSHTKFVYFDDNNRIVKCSSSMAGEILQTVTKYTILAQSLNSKLVSYINKDYIVKGVKYEEEFGLTKAMFGVRLMDTQLKTNKDEMANFLAGAVISNDISKDIVCEIKNGLYKNIYIGGSSPLKDIFKIVLEEKHLGEVTVNLLPDSITEIAPTVGAIKIVDILNKN